MSSEVRPRVLCVDDEPNILGGLALHLRRFYDVVTAPSGADGILEIKKNGAPAVVLSDMRMPGMDGAAFLAQVRLLAPDTVRLLLTGQADLNACIAAINHGQIFRFLTKPCAPDMLLDTLKAAVQQHRLVTGERVLLEQTLRGSVKTLIDVLSLAKPLAFGRASRVKQAVAELSAAAKLDVSWEVEVAAMLSHIGCVTLPYATVEKLYHGKQLNADEVKMTGELPRIAERLLENIPRLENVRAILASQDSRFDGSVRAPQGPVGEAIPVGARILKIVNDFDSLEAGGMSRAAALDVLCGRRGWYDPTILEAFCNMRGKAAVQANDILEIPLKMVQLGMVLVDDVRGPGGTLLIARGHEVNDSLIQRILNFPPDITSQRVRATTRNSARSNTGERPGSRLSLSVPPIRPANCTQEFVNGKWGRL